MWTAIPFAASVVGMLLLIAFKAFELRRGKIFFAHMRALLDARVERLFRALHGEVPHVGRRVASDVGHHLAMQISALALLVIRFTERKLTRFVDMVKGRREIRDGNGTRSTYLRDVTSHRDEVRRVNGYHPRK